MKKNLTFFALLIIAIFLIVAVLLFNTNAISEPSLPGLKPEVFKLALKAYNCAKAKGEVKKPILVIVDYSKPSLMKRLWVLDMTDYKMLFRLHVAQGKGSGLFYATRFSNTPGTEASSLGAFITTHAYTGKHGESLRVKGLEKGINNKALERTIVFHPAWYVTPKFIEKYGRLGRSWGCFAVNAKYSKSLIDTIKDGAVVFVYAKKEQNDPNLKDCKFISVKI